MIRTHRTDSGQMTTIQDYRRFASLLVMEQWALHIRHLPVQTCLLQVFRPAPVEGLQSGQDSQLKKRCLMKDGNAQDGQGGSYGVKMS